MGLNLGPSYGAGGRADALQEELMRRANEEIMRRRTAVMEQESRRQDEEQQVRMQDTARKAAIENASAYNGMSALDIPEGMKEGPPETGGMPITNVQDLSVRPSLMVPGGVQSPTPPNQERMNRIKAMPIPGVAGSGPGMFRAKTAEQIAAEKQQEAYQKAYETPYELSPGQRRMVGNEVIGEAPAADKPDARSLEQRYSEAVASGDERGAQMFLDAMRRARDASQQPEQGKPYFTYQPLYDKQGFATGKVVRYDARGGEPVILDVSGMGGGVPKPPPGTLGAQSVGNEVAEASLDDLILQFNEGAKEDIGPLEGRARTIGQAIPGVPVSQRYADFEAASSSFRNAVIKAITGAQMSEPEAKRIRQQIPEVTDKPEVWMAKARKTRENLGRLKARLQAGAGGQQAAPSPQAAPAQDVEWTRDANGKLVRKGG